MQQITTVATEADANDGECRTDMMGQETSSPRVARQERHGQRDKLALNHPHHLLSATRRRWSGHRQARGLLGRRRRACSTCSSSWGRAAHPAFCGWMRWRIWIWASKGLRAYNDLPSDEQRGSAPCSWTCYVRSDLLPTTASCSRGCRSGFWCWPAFGYLATKVMDFSSVRTSKRGGGVAQGRQCAGRSLARSAPGAAVHRALC